MEHLTISGIDLDALRTALAEGIDHGGNPIEPFTDEAGGWPLRCCLRDSAAGDEIAIIAWSPFPWRGAYAEVGPLVVHASGCPGPSDGSLPDDIDARAMVLRPYGPDKRIAYHRVRHLPENASLVEALEELLEHDDVEFVHGRNVTGGCYSFSARLTPTGEPAAG